MKKLLLGSLFLGSILSSNAQTTVFTENFNAGTLPTGWTVNDADGDGQNWSVVQITEEDGTPSSVYPTPVLRSASWISTRVLNPNNWVFTPALNLTAYAGQTITLKWKVSAADADYDAEKYSVYVSNTNTPAGMLASTTTMTENSLDGVNTLTQRTLNISAFAGQNNIYVAFRHYGVSDEFTMEIDDVEVISSTTVSTDDFFKENFSLYPNPTSDVLNITSKTGIEFNAIKIVDLTGRIVKSEQNKTSINVSDLASGTYLIEIFTNESKATSKFVKK